MAIDQRKDYDSEFCGSIPLNFINLIQSHGLLVVVENTNLVVRQVSENFKAIAGVDAADILNKPLDAFMDVSALNALSEKVLRLDIKDKIPLDVTFKTSNTEIDFSAVVHFKEEYLLMEWELKEKAPGEENSFKRIYQEIRYIMAAIKECDNVREIGDIATAEIKRLSGFDRVLLYQFDEQWNGKVVGESRKEDMQTYMGLRFPASDIPKQARDLYLKNPYRLIPDRDYVPVKLVPVINPVISSFTDLSDCNLRSIPKVHIEYLTNMGVKASMSTPIVINKKLWGLISCHHRTPKNLDYEMKAAFELLSDVIATRIRSLESEDLLFKKSDSSKINLTLLEQIYKKSDFIKGLTTGEVTILDLFHASGAAIFYNNKVSKIGQVPSDDQIVEVVQWLQRHTNDQIFITDSLPRLYDKAVQFRDVGSGLIAIAIGAHQGNYILCFRGELIKTIHWGGDPNQAINFEPDSKNYHPRNSFAEWKETLKLSSASWSETEQEGARVLRTSVMERIMNNSA